MSKVTPIKRVFWTLLASSFVLAIFSSVIAVWLTTRPFLAETRRVAMHDHVESTANQLWQTIREVTVFSTYFAAEPALVDIVIGDAENTDRLIDHLAGLIPPQSLIGYRIFDFSATQIASHNFAETAAVWPAEAEIAELAAGALAAPVPERQPTAYHTAADRGYALTAIPILNRGFLEGTMVALVDLGPISGYSHSDHGYGSLNIVSIESSAAAETLEDPDTMVVPIGTSTLWIAVQPSNELLTQMGQWLIGQNVLSVSLALLVPFSIFALFGRRSILLPHEEVEASRNALRDQQKELAELAAIARKAEESIIVTDLESRLVWANPAFERISGFSVEDVIGKVPGHFLQGRGTDANTVRMLREAIARREHIDVELVNYTIDSDPYWIRLSISPLLDDGGTPYGFMAISSDVTVRKEHEARLLAVSKEIERQALHDDLTGLANRRKFNTAVTARTEAGSETMSLIRIDLDHFKYVNDTLGHDAGDFVLLQVADALRAEAGPGDLPVRVGGDEFIVLLAPGSTISTSQQTAERIRVAIERPMLYQDKTIKVGASFGIASTEDGLLTPATIVQAADAALYKAKNAGRNRVVNYSRALHADVVETRDLAELIKLGIDRGEFVPFYQPQVDAKTQTVTGVEVLARWYQPERGLIAPGGFIDVAEQLSLLTQIDSMVMTTALADISRLNAEADVVPKLSFNITTDRLGDQALLDLVLAQRPRNTQIAFEILESVFLDDQPAHFDFTLDLMRENGLALEIDDFGSGHASMISLMRVRPDRLKIDQRLIMPMDSSETYQSIVAAIIDIARSLDISVTAEGVETLEHAALLRDMGCDTLQGFYFARPMDFAALQVFVQEHGEGHRLA